MWVVRRMNKTKISALQIGSSPEGKQATLEKILSYEHEIIQSGTQLVVMPEALLGGYPKGEIFGTYLGYRIPEGREKFEAYYHNAIDLDGIECQELAALSTRTNADLVVGVIERERNTLFCTALFFSPEKSLVGKHRKLMPTGTERLIWGMGDGSTLTVVDGKAGKIGAAICWENHMPLLRTAMYSKGAEIWCAPTVDERDIWQASMRHIAHEGRCFVVTACQVMASPKELGIVAPEWDEERPLIQGGSMIIDPLGNILAGPLKNQEGLITAEIDRSDIVKSRYDLDVVGHYARPDVFQLLVNESERTTVSFSE